jgi:hypothetical protein
LAASGDVAGSRREYETLLDWWAGADAGLPVVDAATRERDALGR